MAPDKILLRHYHMVWAQTRSSCTALNKASNCCLTQTESLRAQVETIANRALLVREAAKWELSTEQRLLCAVNKALRLPKTVVSRASILPLCLWTSQGLHAADPCSSILLTKDHKRNPKRCWEEFLHCTFHEQLLSPFHLSLLHSCLAFACPNFHAPQGPTKKQHYKTIMILKQLFVSLRTSLTSI